MKTSKLILASSSPQRLSLLKTIGIEPDKIVPAVIEEIPNKKIAEKISESLSFMKACGITPSNTLQLRETEFYTSHEGLLLNYEQSLTRKDTITEEKGWFATSAHISSYLGYSGIFVTPASKCRAVR